jgi:hypothetical protein
MKNINLIGTLIILVSILITPGCGQNYGKLVKFNEGELYYTSAVTTDEVDRLGQYLVAEEFFDGNEKTAQLNKVGNTYEFRMVIKKGLENDQDLIQIAQEFANQLSADVFAGNQVDIHLCDEYLNTLRVVVAF